MSKTTFNFFIISMVLTLGLAASSLPASAAMERSETAGNPVYSNYDRFGLGVMLGVPTGLSAKYRFNRRDAVDFGLAFSFNDYVEVYSDYLYHFPGAFGNGTSASWEFTPYIGIGAVVFADTTSEGFPQSHYFHNGTSSVAVGARIPLGIEWLSHRIPLGVFGEIVPGVGVIPNTFAFFEGAVGARFYF